MPDPRPVPLAEAPPTPAPLSLAARLRARARTILLVIVPLVAVVAGLGFYLAGGRYISTDNAYVGAQKVLITPDVSGKIDKISVREGEHVAAGTELFRIDPKPFELAQAQARAKLAGVRTDFAKLKADYRSLTSLVELADKTVAIKQRDLDRKRELQGRGNATPADVDTATAAVVSAQLQLQYAAQQRDATLNQLAGDPDLPIEKFPAFMQAQAALDQADRDLAHTSLRAPIDGTATQVDNIQLGRFISAGTPVLAVVDDGAPWVDANPKETDVTWLRVGQTVEIDVDAFPDKTFHGTVASVSPGTGAQFAILPPQNASGNWVKVVQRVPVRIVFDKDDDTRRLRAGMSATVEIDTGRQRSLTTLVGLAPTTAQASTAKTR
jgi:membrane fusion protein (multidrug efflux system)